MSMNFLDMIWGTLWLRKKSVVQKGQAYVAEG
jgi:hypothetical protein